MCLFHICHWQINLPNLGPCNCVQMPVIAKRPKTIRGEPHSPQFANLKNCKQSLQIRAVLLLPFTNGFRKKVFDTLANQGDMQLKSEDTSMPKKVFPQSKKICKYC